jgi:hypothetical protein
MFFTCLIQVADTGNPISFAIVMKARDHAAIADFRAVLQRVGNMGDESTGLRSNFAALDSEAPVNAVGTVAANRREWPPVCRRLLQCRDSCNLG